MSTLYDAVTAATTTAATTAATAAAADDDAVETCMRWCRILQGSPDAVFCPLYG